MTLFEAAWVWLKLTQKSLRKFNILIPVINIFPMNPPVPPPIAPMLFSNLEKKPISALNQLSLCPNIPCRWIPSPNGPQMTTITGF